ncbi:hypothetical protein AeRB84_005843, partial [Aphanomyces euteiches]
LNSFYSEHGFARMDVKFQKKHDLQYALQIDECNDKGNVTSVVC